MWNRVFQRLPDNYRKENIEKLHKITYSEFELIEATFKDIKKAHSIEDATGMSLDYIGGNVNQLRDYGESDELYRTMIKLRIISNISQGDIETINEVANALLGDNFIGIRETWNLEEYNNKPAGLVLDMIPGLNKLPADLIGRAVAGGVGINLILNLKQPQPDVYFASSSLAGSVISVYPKKVREINISNFKSNVGIGNYASNEITIYPKQVKEINSINKSYVGIGYSSRSDEITIYPKKKGSD